MASSLFVMSVEVISRTYVNSNANIGIIEYGNQLGLPTQIRDIVIEKKTDIHQDIFEEHEHWARVLDCHIGIIIGGNDLFLLLSYLISEVMAFSINF